MYPVLEWKGRERIPESVGVGGVLTITGAILSPAGGVCGRVVVSICCGILAGFGGSGGFMTAGGSRRYGWSSVLAGKDGAYP